MRPLMVSIGAVLFAIAGVSLLARAADEKATTSKTVQGELIDMHCYSAGGAKGAEHAKCAQKCAASGIPVGVLTSEDKAYTLATNPKPLAKYCAQQIRVTGEVNDKTMTVAPDKVEVQENGNWKEVKLEDAHHEGGPAAG